MTAKLIAGLFVVWLVAMVAGLSGMWLYAQTPGPAANASAAWPAASQLRPEATLPTLMVFAHPQCACSRATIGELSLLMTHVQGRVAARVLFYRPTGEPESWSHSDLWDSAAAIPGVDVVSDENGVEASIFGAAVSGQTLLYDRDGRLMFSGGITAARGHSGDNTGRSALLSLLTRGSAPAAKTPVFGCFIHDAPATALIQGQT